MWFSPSGRRCGAAAAAGTWPSPATSPAGPSTCWRTSSWLAASWAPAPVRVLVPGPGPDPASAHGTRPWGTSGCRSTRAPACRLCCCTLTLTLGRTADGCRCRCRPGRPRRWLNRAVGGARGGAGEELGAGRSSSFCDLCTESFSHNHVMTMDIL